ncbi:MAG: gliding motility-associated ABC transporter ATP-binding subunit GldA [Bacteroidota bacterium]
MSIIVSDITKIYGQQYALDGVSFDVKAGEVIGFLGPNGAGKSTLMKIITCYLLPTSGKASVCGIDVLEDPLSVKAKVGYLPEHNPLYLEMYVKEYLDFIAGLHKVKNKKKRIGEIIEMVGLGVEQNKKIGALSKGYRQRVGLGQALMHDPEVLILDEPTSGLDPNQLEDIRSLIKETGKRKTVLLSTHIMQEVEAICDKVIIINKGKIVANDTTVNLQKEQVSRQVVYVEFDREVSRSKIQSVSGLRNVRHIKENEWVIESESKEDIRPVISRFALDNNMLVLTIRREEQSLEEVFKKLTGKNKN